MNRRAFMLRCLAPLAGLFLWRHARAQRALFTAAAGDSGAAPRDSTAAPVAGPIVTLAVAGDTTLGANLEAHFDEQLAAGVARDQLWPLYFAGVRNLLDSADLSLLNLECPFTARGEKLKKNFNFRARPELVEILKAGAVAAVTVANNHTMDYGPEGLADTIAALDGAGIGRFGAGADLEAARRPLIIECNGLKLGFLGYYFQDRDDMLEPKSLYATRHRPGVAGCFEKLGCMKKQLRGDVALLVPQVDAAIPFFHWGKEGSYEVRDYQIELAHLAVDLGCKAVLGAHPHRLQGIELYRGAPIVYSLGNFVFGGNKDPQDKLSMIVRMRLTRAGVFDVEIVPIQVTRWPEAPFQPFVLEGDVRTTALARIRELSAGFPQTVAALAG